jgi:hypothetical protein
MASDTSCNSIRLLDEGSIHDGSLLQHKYSTTTVTFSSQLSKHGKTVRQCIVVL